MEVTVVDSMARAEALSEAEVIDVDSFIIDELKLVAVKAEPVEGKGKGKGKGMETGPAQKKRRV